VLRLTKHANFAAIQNCFPPYQQIHGFLTEAPRLPHTVIHPRIELFSIPLRASATAHPLQAETIGSLQTVPSHLYHRQSISIASGIAVLLTLVPASRAQDAAASAQETFAERVQPIPPADTRAV
jgi:hypothetical protein